MNRRAFLLSSAAVVAASALPAAAVAASASPLQPAWIVGTPGEYDWIFARGATAEEAKLEWLWSWRGVNKCEQAGVTAPDECDCEFCSGMRDIDTSRFPQHDNIPGEPTPGDWMRAGFGHTCARCGYETHEESGGRGVRHEAVCEECMELADWEIVDPERAAEMREEMADEDAR